MVEQLLDKALEDTTIDEKEAADLADTLDSDPEKMKQIISDNAKAIYNGINNAINTNTPKDIETIQNYIKIIGYVQTVLPKDNNDLHIYISNLLTRLNSELPIEEPTSKKSTESISIKDNVNSIINDIISKKVDYSPSSHGRMLNKENLEITTNVISDICDKWNLKEGTLKNQTDRLYNLFLFVNNNLEDKGSEKDAKNTLINTLVKPFGKILANFKYNYVELSTLSDQDAKNWKYMKDVINTSNNNDYNLIFSPADGQRKTALNLVKSLEEGVKEKGKTLTPEIKNNFLKVKGYMDKLQIPTYGVTYTHPIDFDFANSFLQPLGKIDSYYHSGDYGPDLLLPGLYQATLMTFVKSFDAETDVFLDSRADTNPMFFEIVQNRPYSVGEDLGIKDINDFNKYKDILTNVFAKENKIVYPEITHALKQIEFNILTRNLLTTIGTRPTGDYLTNDEQQSKINGIGEDWLYQIAYFNPKIHENGDNWTIGKPGANKQLWGEVVQTKGNVERGTIGQKWKSFKDDFETKRKEYITGDITITEQDMMKILNNKPAA